MRCFTRSLPASQRRLTASTAYLWILRRNPRERLSLNEPGVEGHCRVSSKGHTSLSSPTTNKCLCRFVLQGRFLFLVLFPRGGVDVLISLIWSCSLSKQRRTSQRGCVVSRSAISQDGFLKNFQKFYPLRYTQKKQPFWTPVSQKNSVFHYTEISILFWIPCL